jgi:hypothetical protein
MYSDAENIKVLESFFDVSEQLESTLKDERLLKIWDEQSILPSYAIGTLVSHMACVLLRIESSVQKRASESAVEVTYEYYIVNDVLRDPEGFEDGISSVMLQEAVYKAEEGQDQVLKSVTSTIERLKSYLNMSMLNELIPLVSVRNGAVKLADFLKWKITELVVHFDDLMASDEEFDFFNGLTEDSMEIAIEVCQDTVKSRYGSSNLLRSMARQERCHFYQIIAL